MKKIIALALCFVMSSFALAGCSGESEPFKKKILRRIHRSTESILMCGTEKLK